MDHSIGETTMEIQYRMDDRQGFFFTHVPAMARQPCLCVARPSLYVTVNVNRRLPRGEIPD